MPAGNLAPHGPPKILNLAPPPPNILNLPTPMYKHCKLDTRSVLRPWIRSAKVRGERRYENGNTTIHVTVLSAHPCN